MRFLDQPEKYAILLELEASGKKWRYDGDIDDEVERVFRESSTRSSDEQ